MNIVKNPRTAAIVAELTELVRCLSESGQGRLPTVHALAATFGCSVGTVSKALHVLRDQGIVRMSQRAGILIVSAVGSNVLIRMRGDEAERSAKAKWERVKAKMLDDLLAGTYPPGTKLPSCKLLQQRYRVCFVTLKRALDSLSAERRIVADKKGFAVYQPPAQRRKPLLVVIARADTASQLVNLSSRVVEFWHTLEQECQRLSMDLSMYTIDEVLGLQGGDRRRHTQFAAQRRDRNIAGYFVWIQMAPLDEMTMLCAELARTNAPVSLLDEVGSAGIPRVVTANRRFQLFTLSIGTTAGRMVADWCIGMGHRRVASIASFSSFAWSRNRVTGLLEGYGAAGLGRGVLQLEVDTYEAWRPLWERKQGSEPFTSIQKHIVEMQRVVNPKVDGADHVLYDHALVYIWRGMLDSILQPLFTRAIGDKSVTAWVAVNDEVALCALQFLRSRGVGVPRQISLVGYDDTLEAIGAGLSSYNFNIHAVVTAMLNHVLGNRTAASRRSVGPIEIPGFIMERASSDFRRTLPSLSR